MRLLLDAIARAVAEVDIVNDSECRMAEFPLGIWEDIIKARDDLLDDEAAEIERRIGALDDARPGYIDRLRRGLLRFAPKCPTCGGAHFALPLTPSGHNPCRDEWHSANVSP